MPDSANNPQRRAAALASALAIFCLLVGGVLAVSLLGVDDEPERLAAPVRCIDLWNKDRAMIEVGRHNASVHRYSRVQVVRRTGEGENPENKTEPAACTVIFARGQLDPEPFAAAYVHRGGGWSALSQFTDERTLALLQAEAVVMHNALLNSDGTIAPY